jgi:hypothetical protein
MGQEGFDAPHFGGWGLFGVQASLRDAWRFGKWGLVFVTDTVD